MSTKQLTFKTIGGEVVTAAQRGKHYVEPRGYHNRPGTGPADETCGTCKHRENFGRYSKCGMSVGGWTGGRATDILVRAPACSSWSGKTVETAIRGQKDE